MQKLQVDANLGSHAGPVSSVVFFSDKVISASLDRSVRVWSPSNPNPSQKTNLISTLDDWALSLAIRPMKSFTTLAAGSCDGSIRLFDVTNNRNLLNMQGDGGHKSAASVLEWLGESTLFSAGYDGKLFLWDTSKPQSPSASRAATAPISSACQLSPNVFVVACIDGSNSLHDFRAQSAVVNFGKRPKGRPLKVVRISDASFAVGGSGKSVAVCDARSGGGCMMEWTGHVDSVTSLASTADGTIVVSGSADKTIRVWNAATGRAMALGRAHQDDVTAVAVQVVGNKVSVAAGSADGKGLSGLSFVLKDPLPIGAAVPVAAPAQLVAKGSVDVEAID